MLWVLIRIDSPSITFHIIDTFALHLELHSYFTPPIWAASSEFGTYRLFEQRKVQASLRIRAVSPEPPLLAHTSSESRGTFRQKARSLAPLNGWACAVKICHDGMLEDTNSLDAAQLLALFKDSLMAICWERAVFLVFCLCYFMLDAIIGVGSLPSGVGEGGGGLGPLLCTDAWTKDRRKDLHKQCVLTFCENNPFRSVDLKIAPFHCLANFDYPEWWVYFSITPWKPDPFL